MAFVRGLEIFWTRDYRGCVVLSPYGLDIIESCLSCKMKTDRLFCDLPASALQSFEAIKYATAYPKGAVLFVEGQAPRGIFVLCKGRVKLSICSTDGKTLILKIAESGEVLGLSATISGKPYELTAETVDPCQINFVKREDFLRFLREHSEACLRVAEQLSEKYNTACREIRSLGLVALGRRKAGPAAAGLERPQRRGQQAGAAREVGAHPRGDRADDRHLARDRDAAVRRIEEAADRAGQRFDAGDPQQGRFEISGHRLSGEALPCGGSGFRRSNREAFRLFFFEAPFYPGLRRMRVAIFSAIYAGDCGRGHDNG